MARIPLMAAKGPPPGRTLGSNRIENGILGRQKHPSRELRIAKNCGFPPVSLAHARTRANVKNSRGNLRCPMVRRVQGRDNWWRVPGARGRASTAGRGGAASHALTSSSQVSSAGDEKRLLTRYEAGARNRAIGDLECALLGWLWPGFSQPPYRWPGTPPGVVRTCGQPIGGRPQISCWYGRRRFGRALRSDRRQAGAGPRPTAERGSGLGPLETKPPIRRLGLLWRAGADLLGLGSWECSLRLSLRRLARPDGRVGQSVARRIRSPRYLGRGFSQKSSAPLHRPVFVLLMVGVSV
jgi:hypothetical protein